MMLGVNPLNQPIEQHHYLALVFSSFVWDVGGTFGERSVEPWMIRYLERYRAIGKGSMGE